MCGASPKGEWRPYTDRANEMVCSGSERTLEHSASSTLVKQEREWIKKYQKILIKYFKKVWVTLSRIIRSCLEECAE